MTNKALADLLALDSGWRNAMLAVPRHEFVPAVGFALPEGGEPHSIDRQSRPDQWMQAVYSDTAIITQRDGGKRDPGVNEGAPTSSLSAPGIAFRFLELLNPREHDRVLEIGTGTGYTAAVLSARLGERNITSVEVDPEVAKQAVANLDAAGYLPSLVVGDGAEGWLRGAPYDRVHATCAVRDVPYAWIEQTRPGGVIVTPWQPSGFNGVILRLNVTDNEAYGTLHGPCGYMMLRAQGQHMTWNAHHADQADKSTTKLDPRSIHGAGSGASLIISALVSGLALQSVKEQDGSFSLLASEVGSSEGSWAACDYQPGEDRFAVNQYGNRRLWDEVSAAYMGWLRMGSPGADRLGVTVRPEGQHLWLDTPGNIIA